MQPRGDEFTDEKIVGNGFREIAAILHAALTFYGVEDFFSEALEGKVPVTQKQGTSHAWNSWGVSHVLCLLPFCERSEIFHSLTNKGHIKREELKKEGVLKSYISQLFPTASSVMDALFYDLILHFEACHVPKMGETREVLFDGLMEYIELLEDNKENFASIFSFMSSNSAFKPHYLKIILPHQRRILRHILRKNSLGLGATPSIDPYLRDSTSSSSQDSSPTLFSLMRSLFPQTMGFFEDSRLLFSFNHTILPTWIKDTTCDLSPTMIALDEVLNKK